MSQQSLPVVAPSSPISDAIRAIDDGQKGIALVVSDDRKLLGTVTDGDVRRAMLASVSLNSPVTILLDRKRGSSTEIPVTARVGTTPDQMQLLMQTNDVRQLPLLDDDGRVAQLIVLDELVPEADLPMQAVIMAGGFGKRLRPLTDDTPKPMLHVGDRPLIEHVIDRLKRAGIRNVNISTFYLPEKISDHFGDGKKFGVDVKYVLEEHPLGTAGALSLLQNADDPVLVTNGDILTSVNYRSMWNFHRKHQATLTVASRKYEIQVPYGVVEHRDAAVMGLTEKPTIEFFVNAGIYLLEPYAIQQIPRDLMGDKQFHMTDLIQRLIDQNRKVVSFPVHEYWLDIGRVDDYERAQEDHKQGRTGCRAA